MSVRSSKRRYLVLPSSGISGPVMQASVFRHGQLLAHLRNPPATAFAGLAADTIGAAAGAALEQVHDEDEFELVSQFFGDGPVIVMMTDGARLALEALHPEVRVVPVTRYRLAGAVSDNVTAAAVSAVGQNGSVDNGDAKQHFLGRNRNAGAGTGVRVGVVDTGVDGAHPALAGKVFVSRSTVSGEDPADGGPANWPGDPLAGHGTHVAGIICASSLNGSPAGAAPGAQVASYRIFPHDRAAASQPTSLNAFIIDAIRSAVDDGCQIINLSLEGSTLREDGVRSAIKEAWENGVVCIAAAGNGGRRPVSYPAALPHCVAVTGIGRDGVFPNQDEFAQWVTNDRASTDHAVFLAGFSNFGPSVAFTAPGHAIVSTDLAGDWMYRSGTSMAAPFVSGVAAALLSANGNLLNAFGDTQRSAAIVQLLVSRARPLGFAQSGFEGYGLPLP